jgi:hypothetical protein
MQKTGIYEGMVYMDGVIFTWALIFIGIGIVILGLYALIKKAVKDALKEFNREKNKQADSEISVCYEDNDREL